MNFTRAMRLPALAALLGALSCGALGQGAGITLPGQIERQFRMLPQPRSDAEMPAAPTPADAMPPGAQDIRFVLSAITLDGAQRLSVQEVDGLAAPYLHREISLADLYTLAGALSAAYRDKGYLLSQVIVPAQEISGGTVRLQAVEGYVDQVLIEGGQAAERDLVAEFGMKIRSERPLTSAALERYMLLINDLPGIYAYATLSPSPSEFAAADLHIHVSERRLDAGVSADNRGGRVLGTERVIADVAVANLLGRHDNTSLKLVGSPGGELAYIAMRHEQPVGSEGGKLSLAFDRTRAQPEQQGFVPLELETRSRGVHLGYLHPALRSRRENVFMRASLDAHDGEERVFGIKDREDRLRSLRLGLTWDFEDRHGGTNLLDVEASLGLQAFGASANDDPLLTRAGGRTDYSKLAFFAARLQDLAPRWTMLAALAGQHAHTELLSSELFAFGGEPFGRGYDPSELVGDHGAAAKLELRYADQLPFGAGLAYQAYGFYDIGRVWSRSDDGGADASAASVGLGARLVIGPSLNGFIELARPLTRRVGAEGDKDARIYAGVSARM